MNPHTSLSLPPNATASTRTGTRITFTTQTAYTTVLDRFRTLVPQMPLPPNLSSRAAFESQVQASVGDKHEFAKFFEINHGAWIRMFPSSTSIGADKADTTTATTASGLEAGAADDDADDQGPNGGRGLVRFIFGNPLVAITMIREDVLAGLYAPVEALFVEQQDGGANCVFELPSGLVVGDGVGKGQGQVNERLWAAARVLDGKVLSLIQEVMA